MKVAIYGGSFDPPHMAHEYIVEKVKQSLSVSLVFIIPTYLNPFKQSFFLSPKNRLFLVKKLWENDTKIKVIDYEIKNQRPTSSYESVLFLKQKYNLKKIYFILGADNYEKLSLWYNYEKLKNLVEFVFITRKNFHLPKNVKTLQIDINISSTILRKNLSNEFLPIKIKQDIIKLYKEKQHMQKRLDFIVKILDEKKAEDIQIFDMSQKDYFVQNVIIATTIGEKHASSLVDILRPKLKENKENVLHEDSEGEWAILDLGDILIHLMSEEYRIRYNLEDFLTNFEKQREI